MSLTKRFYSIGVRIRDCEELIHIIRESGSGYTLNEIARITLENNKRVYHHKYFSRPFKMLLRVIVGFLVFGEIDQPHRDAIFYEFESPDRMYQSDPDELETFYRMLRKFWSHKTLSKPVCAKINALLEDPSARLLNNLIEFEYPFNVTRAKSHLLSMNKAQPRQCRADKLKENIEYDGVNHFDEIMQRADYHLTDYFIDFEHFRHGFYDGDIDGYNDGVIRAEIDQETGAPFNALPGFINEHQSNSCWYNDGYRTGYMESYIFHYRKVYKIHKPKCIKCLF